MEEDSDPPISTQPTWESPQIPGTIPASDSAPKNADSSLAASIVLPRSASSSLRQLQSNGADIELSTISQSRSSSKAALSVPLPSSSSSSRVSTSDSQLEAGDLRLGIQRVSSDKWVGNASPEGSLTQLVSATAGLKTTDHRSDGNFSAVDVELPVSSSSSLRQLQQLTAGGSNGRNNEQSLESRRDDRDEDIPSTRSAAIPAQPAPSPPPPPPPPAGSRLTYRDRVAHLARLFPQLEVMQRDYCRAPNAGLVSCYDYHADCDLPSIGPTFNSSTWNSRRPSRRFRDLCKIDDSTVVSRVLLVEDLSPKLIDALGTTFNLPPSSFAEHLNQSGYSWDSYNDQPVSKWNDATIRKSHVSLSWFRPVRQEKVVTGWLESPEKFLITKFATTGSDSESTSSRGSSSSKSQGAVSWIDFDYQEERRAFVESRTYHKIIATTNILRKCWPLSTRNKQSYTEEVPVALDKQSYASLVPVAWEEKATLVSLQDGTVQIMVILLDPLPAMIDEQEIVETRFQGPFIHAADSGYRTDENEVQMYRPIHPRHLQGFTDNDTDMAPSLLHVLQTTRSISLKMFAEPQALQHPDRMRTDPVISLVKTLHVDTKALLECLEWLLDEISQDSLDDYLLSKHLQDWRSIMNVFSSALPAVGNSLQAFVHFVYRDSLPDEVTAIVGDLDTRILRSIDKLKEAHNALRSDLAIMESRRSIAEAETVTKLTELAFAFIPLTFASSIFSMQLLELGNGVNVGTFIFTAVLIAALCYGLRILLRSSLVAESKRRALENFWSTGRLKPGSKIPTRKLVELTAREFWRNGGPILGVSIFIFIMAFTAVPVAFMWTSTNLGSSWNTVMTLVLLPCGGIVAWVCTSSFVTHSDTAHLPLSFRAAMWLSHRNLRRRKRKNENAA